ncbi:SIR2 family NAD-dependent protein deacylase [Pyxidicoccus trucidator]|uniref:SIR2 family NAD-dependent protein deacylase n=1 Tax=Pyxidicoccus trucidator TaxID=2709662 RepID=UPI0013DD6F00|nr:SIR2 family protein [Pyxidicoccus trucidator]
MRRTLEDELVEALRDTHNTLLVVGSGVSVGATEGKAAVASWKGLIDDGIAYCVDQRLAKEDWVALTRAQLNSGEVDHVLFAAEAVRLKLGASERSGQYTKWLRRSVGELKLVKRDVVDHLVAFGVPLATTNYDDLLEEATGLPPITWRNGPGVEEFLRGRRPAILHLHGHWDDPESVILGLTDYFKIVHERGAQALQSAAAASRTLVFVGCGEGLEDPNLGALLKSVLELFKSSTQPHYLLVRNGEVEGLESRYPPTGKLRVVGYGADYTALGPFLGQLSARCRSSPR